MKRRNRLPERQARVQVACLFGRCINKWLKPLRLLRFLSFYRVFVMPLITTRNSAFYLQEGETLLEALERTGHEVEYQCRSGYCGSCRLRLLSGSVRYRELPLAFLAPGEILPCCCVVKEDIELDCAVRQREPDLFERDLFGEEQAEE
ncbi:2Fe-2S iron-sulfur cluster binding protein [Neisseria shayeganii 871]|uniref:2Fe-2S iron-sulfur cluster binding protein n=2 Tax=Neisseria shayeganii TaxID=607712 RepID=G4CFL5_9NEIS|nr:2Fe-2S iron-sulfur cluster binding protein [Neisseria shayeganii 871]